MSDRKETEDPMIDFDRELQERNKALLELDMEYARRQTPGVRDEALLVGMHKARVEILVLPELARRESMKFLKDRGFSRLQKLPWPKNDQLPE